jgi:hypothetical protein
MMWLRYYATSRKVAGSRPNEVVDFFLTYLIHPAALGPGVHLASNRKEYQKQKNMFLESRARLKISPPYVSRLSRQCGIISISHTYRPRRPVTGIDLLFNFMMSLIGSSWATRQLGSAIETGLCYCCTGRGGNATASLQKVELWRWEYYKWCQ